SAAAPAPPAPADSPAAGTPWDDEDTFVTFILDCSGLKPITDPGDEPALQRLHNLGYGGPDSTDRRTTLHAIQAFQRDYQLKASGAIDNLTRQKVRDLYGS